jgi:hypothetical protein
MGRKKEITKLETSGDDRIDAFIGYLINGGELTEKQQSRFEIMLKVNGLLCSNMTLDNVMKFLTSEKSTEVTKINGGKPYSIQHAYRIIHDSYLVFGDVAKVSVDGRRHVLHESFLRIARKAEEAQDFASAISALDRAAKLYDLYSPDRVLIDAERYLIPVPILMVNDERALMEDDEQKALILKEIEGIYQYGTNE